MSRMILPKNQICPCGGVIEPSKVTETKFLGYYCIDCGRKFRQVEAEK